MTKKILTGLMLLAALSSTPAFADADDVPVQVQMNSGVVRVMKLEKAQRIQARGQGIIIGGVAPYGTYSTGTYVYPNGYTWPSSNYVYPNRTYNYRYPYPYPYSNPYTYPNGTYSYPYGYNRSYLWGVPSTDGAGHPHQHDYDSYGW